MQPGAVLYTQGFGSRPESVEVPFITNRAPTTLDTMAGTFPIGKFWVNQTLGNVYCLGGYSTSGGTLSATWAFLGGTSGDLNTLTGDAGGAIGPSSGNINVLGTANQITSTGAGSTITWSLIGPYTPATYTAHGVLVGEGTSSIVATAAGTNGQVLLGATGADPAFGTLTTTTGISFTTGANSLAVNTKTGGFAVVNQTSSTATLAAQTMYVTNNGSTLVTYTLPATVAQGTTIKIVGLSAGGWKIAQNAGQTITLDGQTTTSGTGGSVSSVNASSNVTLIATDATTNVWVISSASGALNFV